MFSQITSQEEEEDYGREEEAFKFPTKIGADQPQKQQPSETLEI